MNTVLQSIKESVLQLFYPHVCAGCGNDALASESQLCIKCIHQLPFTSFEKHNGNPIEKMLSGRIAFNHATSLLYFTKESLIQRLMHEFKYRSNKDLGRQLGAMMGSHLKESSKFNNAEALIPLPLFENKEYTRGFNQSKILCEGISEVMKVEIINDAIIRPVATETQTKKGRVERWRNMEGKFRVISNSQIKDKHILLIDDVITTGATIEACAGELINSGAKVSIATLCFASNV